MLWYDENFDGGGQGDSKGNFGPKPGGGSGYRGGGGGGGGRGGGGGGGVNTRGPNNVAGISPLKAPPGAGRAFRAAADAAAAELRALEDGATERAAVQARAYTRPPFSST